LNSVTEQAASFLEGSVAAGLNILVSGGTQTGKTTMLNALCAAIPARERTVTVEEVFELQLQQPDVVAMQTRQANLEGTGEIPLRRLVNELSECGQVASSSVRSDRRNMSIWTRSKK
jgi:pilus assembly protein CpaF